MNTGSVDSYFTDGCGRCSDYQTPQCKVHTWAAPLAKLRALLDATELESTLKWGSPTYTIDGKNVLMLACYRDCAFISFFQGVLLDDPDGRLVPAGPNAQAGRLLKVTSAEEVDAQQDAIRAFVEQAIALKRSGAKAVFDKAPEPMPDELLDAIEADPALLEAWEDLTPGRRRSHVIHVGGAKQAATRLRRVEKCIPKILAGKGFLDR